MKKKLLFINGHMNTGGVEKSLLDILKHLDGSRYEVTLLLFEGVGDYAPEIPAQIHVELKNLKNTYGSLPGSLLRCIRQRDWFCFRMRLVFLMMQLFGQKQIRLGRKLLTGNRHYDCVIGFRPGICTQVAAFAVHADRRLTWWHHGEINVDRVSYLKAASACDRVVAVSQGCRELLEQAFPTLRNRLTVIPNMVDTDKIRQKAAAFRPYPAGCHIVSVGRLSREKHFENAVSAAAALKGRGFRFQWHIIGDGAEKSDLEKQIRELNVADCVVLEGNQVNPYPFIRWADLFVHPSYVESQGLVVLEALALGVPCVVTKTIGTCGFIEDGRNGLMCDLNAESLLKEVAGMMSDRDLYLHIKSNSVIPGRFSPEEVMSQIEQEIQG